MSRIHVIPEGGLLEHDTKDGLGCWCLPVAEEHGSDTAGDPAVVFVHHEYDANLNLVSPLQLADDAPREDEEE